MQNHEILLGLTTTPASDWRGKVEEMKKFGIKRIALFPTFLKMEDRKILYILLEEIEDLEIPHVHLRNDMGVWEAEMFKEKYKTEAFNIHFESLAFDGFEKFNYMTFVENRFKTFDDQKISAFGGLCVDFAHMEDGRKRPFAKMDPMKNGILDRSKIGCCHVSASKRCFLNPINWIFGFDRHYLKNLKELDYLKKYVQYLPKYISLELENSFEEQIKAKEYLEKKVLN
jgi:hypothetical protein